MEITERTLAAMLLLNFGFSSFMILMVAYRRNTAKAAYLIFLALAVTFIFYAMYVFFDHGTAQWIPILATGNIFGVLSSSMRAFMRDSSPELPKETVN